MRLFVYEQDGCWINSESIWIGRDYLSLLKSLSYVLVVEIIPLKFISSFRYAYVQYVATKDSDPIDKYLRPSTYP